MKPPRFRLRAAMLALVAIALAIELAGLGRTYRHRSTRAAEAAEAERINLLAIENGGRLAEQLDREANDLALTDPAGADALRARARAARSSIAFFRDQARRAADVRDDYEQAARHPWASAPPEVDPGSLRTTPPVRP